MALSYVQYSGDGVTAGFSVPFPYIDKTHVTATVDGVSATFTWTTDNTIQMDAAPGAGTILEVRRKTPNDTRMVVFVDGSNDTAKIKNLQADQFFYITQEAIDFAQGSLAIAADGSYSAGGRRVSDVGDPTGSQDVATKNYVDTSASSQVAQAAASAAAAAASETAAANSETAAGASETHAAASEAAAAASASAASTSETNAAASAAAASTSETNAAASAAAASGSATAAQGYAANSAASAAQANDLVTQATAGFSGFNPNASYDFGSVATAMTYFDQDWGGLI